jgi:putative transposase
VQVAKTNPTGRTSGVDMGVAVLAAVADTDGEIKLVKNPQHLTRRLDQLARAQQALAACKKTGRRDGGRRQKAKTRVARLHRQVRDAHKNEAHQLSKQLVGNYDVIYVEKLRITNMTRSAAGTIEQPGSNVAAKSGLNRSILDASWGQLIAFTTYSAQLPAMPAAQ